MADEEESVNPTDDRDLLEEVHERLADCVDDEAIERVKMQDDLRFCTLDQWDFQIRKDRESDPSGARPCLTIDKINQYIVQVVNDMRQNRPSIKPRPVDDKADVETAKIFQGLIRHIEDRSDASIAYETAGESAVKIGLGYFRIVTEYADGSGDEQEACFKRIPDTFTVYLGPHVQPDGSDAEYGFILEQMPEDKFKRENPGKKFAHEDFDGIGDAVTAWRTADSITVCEYFYTEYEQSTVVSENALKKRQVRKKSIKWCKLTGIEVLERTDWPGKYIPIVEVVGRESFIKGKRILWGLVRPTKDVLRMNNYWMSAITEKIGLAPKVPFVGAVGQFEGVEQQWKNANRDNRAYLEYKLIDVNGNAVPPPKRVDPAPLEVAMVNMTGMLKIDVKEALGMYKAAVGDSESQQSGRAILALQKESDTGTFHFSDNLARSIRHAGRILVDLIPKIYDTARVVRILGEDGQAQNAMIDPLQPTAMRQFTGNDGSIQRIYNLGVGTYDVTVTVGPSYTTARQEAATILTELANSAKDPASAAVMRYLAIKNSDFQGSDEMTSMLKALLPPALQQLEGDQQQIPPQVQAKMQQMQQMMQAAAEKIKQLETGEAQAQAKIAASHQEAMAGLDLKKQMQAEEFALQHAKATDALNLERQSVMDRTVFDKWKAELDAATKVLVAQISAKADHEISAMQAENEANIEFMKKIGEPAEGGNGGAEAQPQAGLQDVMMQLAATHKQLVDHMSRPKTMTIQQDASGMPTGGIVQ